MFQNCLITQGVDFEINNGSNICNSVIENNCQINGTVQIRNSILLVNSNVKSGTQDNCIFYSRNKFIKVETSTIETIKELIKQHHQYEQEPDAKSDKDSQISDINDEDLKIIKNNKNKDYLHEIDTLALNIGKQKLQKYSAVGDIMNKFKQNSINQVDDAIVNVKKELLNWRLNNEMSMNDIALPITY